MEIAKQKSDKDIDQEDRPGTWESRNKTPVAKAAGNSKWTKIMTKIKGAFLGKNNKKTSEQNTVWEELQYAPHFE